MDVHKLRAGAVGINWTNMAAAIDVNSKIDVFKDTIVKLCELHAFRGIHWDSVTGTLYSPILYTTPKQSIY